MKRDGVGMIIGVRLFSLFICVVLVFSVMKIATSFDKYKKIIHFLIYMDIWTYHHLIIELI